MSRLIKTITNFEKIGKPIYLYLNIRARGELPRLVAAVGKIDYVDKRITFSEWPEYKSKMPYGQIPALDVDGRWYAQKLAISLYFARKAGLYPTSGNPLDILKYDRVLNFTEEILEQIVLALTAKLTALKADVLPTKVELLENLLKENGSGFFVDDKLSVVDLSAFDVTEHIVDIQGKSYLDTFPLLKAHFERVGKNEELKKYVASRPPPQDFNF